MMAVSIFKYYISAFWLVLFCHAYSIAYAQDDILKITSFEDYLNELIYSEDDYLPFAEECRELIDGFIDNPVSINSTDIEILEDLHIITRLQLNKLKEYRLIYGDLLSIHELRMIESWDERTIRKVVPLITLSNAPGFKFSGNIKLKAVHQQLLIKTSFITEKRKGYKIVAGDSLSPGPIYLGSPVKLSLRYDLEYRKRFTIGLRMEKDPGEPYLIKARVPVKWLKTPDLLSGFLHINRLGPFRNLILGDFKVSFGLGINFSGGQFSPVMGNGPPNMVYRIRGQTSLSETGFLRGAAMTFRLKKLAFTAFGSWQNIDGSSIVREMATEKILSFSSLNRTGLHRTSSELLNRKTVNERILGGMLVFGNNWLKTGMIAFQNQYNSIVTKNPRPYAAFSFTGRSNFVAGISTSIWLPKTQLFSEVSLSRNKGWACIAGIIYSLSTGGSIILTGRNFSKDYQNWYGSGYISQARNYNERGLGAALNLELASRWRLMTLADHSESSWFRYNLGFPTRQFMFLGSLEKSWIHEKSMIFSVKYLQRTIHDQGGSNYISKPGQSGQWRFRLESRYTINQCVNMKSRIEVNMPELGTGTSKPGWLMTHDISYATLSQKFKIWFRTCFFQVEEYENRIYAYENDVLYDFTSFMHYGKGTRGIMMISWRLLNWLDLWVRASTVHYKSRTIGTGWDEINGDRMNEIDIQIRIRNPV